MTIVEEETMSHENLEQQLDGDQDDPDFGYELEPDASDDDDSPRQGKHAFQQSFRICFQGIPKWPNG